MRREVLASDLEKLYTANDMARVGCQDCRGCCDCCQGMGESVILDPLDIWRLSSGLGETFAGLMEKCLELNTVDGIVLPNLRMKGKDERCVFLNDEQRCSIHEHRPGLCRLFPLGRYYQDGGYRYFLQQQECRMEPKTKVKISKWIDTPNLRRYERFALDWHDFLEEVQDLLAQQNDDQLARDLNVYILENLYAKPYGERDFYEEFGERIAQVRRLLNVLVKSEIKTGDNESH